MSKNINVNPDHYKVAGRERQGEDVVHEIERSTMAQDEAARERWQAKKKPAAPKKTKKR